MAAALRQGGLQQCPIVNVGFDDNLGRCLLAEIILWQKAANDLLAGGRNRQAREMIAAAEYLAVANEDDRDAMYCVP